MRKRVSIKKLRAVFVLSKTFFCSAIIFVCCIAISAQNKISIRVVAETTIDGEIVRLENVARIAGDESKSEKLKNLSLGYAPNIGMVREISLDQIKMALRAAGFTESEIALQSPPKILIWRAAQNVGPGVLRETVEKAVLENFHEENVTARIVRLDLPDNLDVPAGELAVNASFSGVRNFFTPFIVSLEIRVNGHVFRRVSATVEVEAFAETLVAARDLSFKDKISEADVKIENRRLEKPLANYIRTAEKLRGAVLIKNVSAGTVLTTDAVAAGIVVKSGDTVRIEGQSGKLKIIVMGEARGSGKIGDRIAVKNSQSGILLQATVIDENSVRVDF